MSDHAKIDDVFSIPDQNGDLDEPSADEIFTRTIDIVVTAIVPKTNGHRHQDGADGANDPPDTRDEPAPCGNENVLDHLAPGPVQKEEISVTEQPDPHYFPNGATKVNSQDSDHAETVEDLSDIRAVLAQAERTDPLLARQNGTAIETTERTTYLRLVSEKAVIQYSFLQNPEYRTRSLALIHRLDVALSLLEEIISSGTTLQQATREFAELDQEILKRIQSQVSRQRSIAEQTQQPLDNQTRATAHLPPLAICIGEDLRLKLLKASVLKDINSFV